MHEEDKRIDKLDITSPTDVIDMICLKYHKPIREKELQLEEIINQLNNQEIKDNFIKLKKYMQEHLKTILNSYTNNMDITQTEY